MRAVNSPTTRAAHRTAERAAVALSVVIPVYGCAASLRPLHARLTAVLAPLVESYEIVFVDDRAGDASWEILTELADDPHVVACRLSRNFGQHIAITAGLARCRGAHAVVMDCDLQDPPEFIPQLYAAAMAGNAIVYARRKSAYQSTLRNLANRVFVRTISWMTKQSLDGALGSFSIIARPVIDAFLQFGERDRQYLMILGWLGFTSTTVDYERDERPAGRSSYTLRRLLAHALAGVFFSTTRPLRWIIYVGLAFTASGTVLGAFEAARHVSAGTALVFELIIGGMIIISIGTAALYVARAFDAVRQRPLYVVEQVIGGEDASASSYEPKIARMS